MTKVLNVPLGSQHVALLEPVSFRLTTKNERVVEVTADVGYVHRGIEKACETKFKFKQIPFVVSRVCGLCSITHATTSTLAIEKLLNLEVPKKAKYLRILALELDRIHSHLLCLAHTAENAGYEALFMRILRDREHVMELQEILTGNRVHFDYVAIGGVNRDFDSELNSTFEKYLKIFEDFTKEIKDLFLNNWSLSLKYKGVGAISQDRALEQSLAGPLIRACGLKIDVRAEFDFLPYSELDFNIITHEGGDVYARNMVRLDEIFESIKLIRAVMNNLPDGEIQTKVKGNPEGEAIVRLEAPRGELFYYIKGSKRANLDRVRIKTPTFTNIPSMIDMLTNQEYANVPAIIASFDPCLSCTAK